MAAIANLLIDQGASFSSTVTVYNSDDTVFDLTDYTGAAQVRKSYSSSSASGYISFNCFHSRGMSFRFVGLRFLLCLMSLLSSSENKEGGSAEI